MNLLLCKKLRQEKNKNPEPSLIIIDSQSIKQYKKEKNVDMMGIRK
jgi:hypothetical protein